MPNLLDWQHIDDATWSRLVARAQEHYRTPKSERWTEAARGKSLGMLFFNPSLRTRTSMELAARHLGAHATTLDVGGKGVWGFAWDDEPMTSGAAEHIEEAVGVLSRYYDALGVRLFASGTDLEADRSDALLHAFAEAASVPVVSLESAFYHPCQALADAATIQTLTGGQAEGKRFVLTWAPHPKPLPSAVPNSALLMAARLGMNVTVARPETHRLDESVMDLARGYAEGHGLTVEETDNPRIALDDADVVYAKAWGGPLVYTEPEREAEARAKGSAWRVTAERMARTNAAPLLHCLPVRRGVVVDADVLKAQTAHFLQAEYRLHAQKAALEWAWGLG
jgi:N-acetylornithine carbamoyltransferase